MAGVGCACIDYIIPIDDVFLSQIHAKKGNCTVYDWEPFLHIFQSVSEIKKPFIATGGSTANTIKGLAQLGISCALISKVGKDEIGSWFKNVFSSMGVECRFLSSELPTAQIMALITDDGERTFCVYQGSEKDFCEEDLTPLHFSDTRLVHIEGYQLRCRGIVEKTLTLAKENDCLVSLDLCDASLARHYRDRLLKDCLPHVDILFANEEEALALTGLAPQEACTFLNQYCPIVAIKVGAKGCWIGTHQKCFHCPGFPVQLIDTNGAGDLFASGFLYGVLTNASLYESACYGNLLGSAVVQEKGAEIPLHKWDHIKKMITCISSSSAFSLVK